MIMMIIVLQYQLKILGNTAKKIEKEGINIIGVALEDEKDETECYEALKEIYNRVIDVNDIKCLTTQLLNLISKLFI
jgi:nitric oxide reductase activation protein